MEFEWDDGKDRANRAKHGLPLADAARLDWEGAGQFVDGRRDYGEERLGVVALLDGRAHVCIFTLRGGVIRVISLRKAKRREVRKHGTG